MDFTTLLQRIVGYLTFAVDLYQSAFILMFTGDQFHVCHKYAFGRVISVGTETGESSFNFLT